jgi:hypothetical protein
MALASDPDLDCDNGQLGECHRDGFFECVGPDTTACNALAVMPSPEACNSLDDDCNGVVDDGDVCGGSSEPVSAGTRWGASASSFGRASCRSCAPRAGIRASQLRW